MRSTCARSVEGHVGSVGLKTHSQPNFNDRLPCNSQFAGFTIQRVNHPSGKTNIHPLLRLQHAPCFGQVQRNREVDTLVKLLLEVFSFNKVTPFLRVRGERTEVCSPLLRLLVFPTQPSY